MGKVFCVLPRARHTVSCASMPAAAGGWANTPAHITWRGIISAVRFPPNSMYLGVIPSLLPADPQVSFGSLVSVADKQAKTQNNLAKAGSSWKSHLSRCVDQLRRVPLCKVRSIFLSQYSLAAHRCVCSKADYVDFPQDFARSGPSCYLFRINFLGRAGRPRFPQVPPRKHHVFP